MVILPRHFGHPVKSLFLSYGNISAVKDYYPKVEYSEPEIV
jgi:hypothetical protein